MVINSETEWIERRLSLGTVAQWSANEIRLISELAFNLSEQGRNEEAIRLFEGLHTLAPATIYFQSALGSLYLRVGMLDKAIEYLTKVLNDTPDDLASRINRGEAFLRLGEMEKAKDDLEIVSNQTANNSDNVSKMSVTRAKALYYSIENKTFKI